MLKHSLPRLLLALAGLAAASARADVVLPTSDGGVVRFTDAEVASFHQTIAAGIAAEAALPAMIEEGLQRWARELRFQSNVLLPVYGPARTYWAMFVGDFSDANEYLQIVRFLAPQPRSLDEIAALVHGDAALAGVMVTIVIRNGMIVDENAPDGRIRLSELGRTLVRDVPVGTDSAQLIAAMEATLADSRTRLVPIAQRMLSDLQPLSRATPQLIQAVFRRYAPTMTARDLEATVVLLQDLVSNL